MEVEGLSDGEGEEGGQQEEEQDGGAGQDEDDVPCLQGLAVLQSSDQAQLQPRQVSRTVTWYPVQCHVSQLGLQPGHAAVTLQGIVLQIKTSHLLPGEAIRVQPSEAVVGQINNQVSRCSSVEKPWCQHGEVRIVSDAEMCEASQRVECSAVDGS